MLCRASGHGRLRLLATRVGPAAFAVDVIVAVVGIPDRDRH
jgi:hypothetical protein